MLGIVRHKDIFGTWRTAATAAGIADDPCPDAASLYKAPCWQRGDSIYMEFQYNHDKKLDANVDGIHMHLVPLSDPGANSYTVFFDVLYTFVKVGDSVPDYATWTPTQGSFTVNTASYKKTRSLHTGCSHYSAGRGELFLHLACCPQAAQRRLGHLYLEQRLGHHQRQHRHDWPGLPLPSRPRRQRAGIHRLIYFSFYLAVRKDRCKFTPCTSSQP